MKSREQEFNLMALTVLVTIILAVITPVKSHAQLVVETKNITEDKGIHYIQLMYYVEKKTFRPVYIVDYGIKNVENVNLKPEIKIDGESVKELTPIGLLNKLYAAGWEYLGDYIYIQNPGMPMHTYTLKRRILEPDVLVESTDTKSH
jgi:hypothetical protein